MSRPLTLRVADAVFFTLLLAGGLSAAQGPVDRKTVWAEIEQLIQEQKVETAYERLDALLPAIRGAGDPQELTRALIRGAQLRAAAVEPAEAVRFLQGQSWPADRRQRAVLYLFYAKALENYYNEYRREIWKRESIRAEEPVDVEKWTTGEIFEAASQAYFDAWKEREILGAIPVTELAEFLEPNNYPKEARGTLRDMTSYLWVELLTDTAWWSPAQSNATERFDLVAMSRNDEVTELQLADREVHPLVRAMMVLSDLERWHAAEGNQDGALEARLERFRQLGRHALADETKALRAELENLLPAYRDVPWWATGMAELADLYRYSGDVAAAVRIARAGREAWPKSPGGERCLALIQQLEAPLYYLNSAISDAPGRRSLQVQHKNLPALWFRAFEIDLQQRLDQTGQPLYPRLDDDLFNGRPAYEWKTDLPATPDLQVHTTYVTPPIDRPGAYVVVASGRQDFAIQTGKEYLQNLLVATPLILGDLALVARRNERNQMEVVALTGSRGEPVPGVEARLYEVSRERRGLRGTGASNADGILPFDPYQGYAVFARQGNDVALLLSSAYSGERNEQTGTRSLIFTDRSIYRPQQNLLWKVLVYDNFGEGRFEGIADRPVTVSLKDPNGEVVDASSVTTNGFGTASGEFTIPPGRPLGGWTIEASEKGQAFVRVEEYKRPTFEVLLEEPKEALRLGRLATFPGKARYYFGLPVARGEVKWQAYRQGFFPWWWGGPGGDTEMVATGTAELSPDGTFEIAFTPEAGALKGRDPRQISYFFQIDADLTDEGDETRSAQRSFRLGYVSIEAEISVDQGLLIAGEPAKVTIARRDLAGIARPGDATWTLLALRQPAEALPPADLPPLEAEGMEQEGFRTDGDDLRPRFDPSYDPLETLRQWEDGDRVASGGLVHGKDGQAELTLPALAPGAYRLRYETADEGGEPFSTWRELIVAGDVTPLALPAVLAVDTSGAEPGGRVRILAHSGFADQLVWLETWRNSELKERRPLRMGRDASLIEMPIGKQDRGGFTLKLVTLRDHQLMELSEDVYVPWEDRRLEVEVATFRDRIRPGSHETWTVKVQPAEGEPELAGAELLAYLYDRSLDLFAPHEPADPLDLYPTYTGLGISASSLGRSSAYGAGHGWRQDFAGPNLRKDEIPFRFAFRKVPESPMHVEGVVGGFAPPPPSPSPMPKALKLRPPFAEQLTVIGESPLLDERRISTGATVKQSPPVELRSDFSETAFWQPHLIAGADGTAAIEFDVPDSVTSWSFWVHALTRDLRAGSLQKEVRSVKNLMVRPYVPRFLRESDEARLEIVVNNASDGELRGKVTLDVVDPETGESLLADFGLKASKARAPFIVAAGGGTSVSFPLTTPKRVGPVAFKVTATAGKLSDGELRPLPILPSRMHLMQSRFAALTTGRKELRFEDMMKSDPTRIDEQMVVTLDAQLFYSVLESVPYLVNYPYECTEQTLNRFLSTGILAKVADQYPAVAAMAEEMSHRETRYETWDAVDPNRKMALEETPWLALSRGGDSNKELIKVLDPRVARAQRDEALEKLQQAQLESGAFPWWSGGQASPYMTLLLLYGVAKASEFGIEIPEEMVQNGWRYLNEWFQSEEISLQAEDKKEGPNEDTQECCRRELLVFLNYVASSYPEALGSEERQKILDYTFTHWRELSGYLKVLLALTLNRMDRPDNAKLVFDAVMDLSDTTEEEGTFWAPEKEGWLWFNDNIETHAFALLAMMELTPEDPRRHGLVQWLFLNKQLNHWHSTKATSEVIYALVRYLEKEGQLGISESVTIRVGRESATFTFEPERFTGKHNQMIVPGEQLDPRKSSTVVIEKDSPALMFASATWHFSTDQLPAEARGDLFGVTRRYFLRSTAGKEVVLSPLNEGTALRPGDEVEVHLTITSRAPAEYVHLRDPRAAGLEPDGARSGYVWDWTSPGRYEETRDSGNNFFFEWLPAGEFTFKYRLRANMAGTFRVGPARLQSMYAPDFAAYSAGNVLTVAPAEP